MNPDLYIDVDGVILYQSNEGQYLNGWLINFIIQNKMMFGKLYWLSCWTSNGSAEPLFKQFPSLKELGALPLEWRRDKTEAIDWSRPFIWIEDGVGEDERKEFERRAVKGQQIWEVRAGEWSQLRRR